MNKPTPDLYQLLLELNPKITAEEVDDILWLALHLDRTASTVIAQAPDSPDGASEEPAVHEPFTRGMAQDQVPDLGQPPGPRQAELYPASSDWDHASQARSLPFDTPAARALPDPLALGRAMRPLNRRVPSRVRFNVDVQATVDTMDETGQWRVAFRPEAERWLDVVLVVDASPSMVVWAQTIREFAQLLAQQGAFRGLQVWHFTTHGEQVQLQPGDGWAEPSTTPRNPRELIDLTGQRMILVLSDCVSAGWHNGTLGQWLKLWGQSNFVAIVQLLPQWLWSGLGWATSVRLRSRGMHQWANADFAVTLARPKRRKRQALSDPSGTATPILTLEPDPLAQWAGLLSGSAESDLPGVVVPTDPHPRPLRQTNPGSAESRVTHFRATASATAWRLAGYLAAVPLSLPVMRLVQRVMLPDSKQTHLAEILLSDLLIQRDDDSRAQGERADPADLRYEFVDGVRAQLNRTVLMSETVQVLDKVSTFIDQRTGQTLHFRALLADPEQAAHLQLSDASMPFARVAAEVLQRMGGRYRRLAEQLGHSVERNDRFVVEAETDAVSPGMSADLIQRCRDILLRCHEFENQNVLWAVFATSELRPFQDRLPEAKSIMERVNKTTDYLISKKLSDGRPLLPVFLDQLSTNYHKEDELYQQLRHLYYPVEIALNKMITPVTGTLRYTHPLYIQRTGVDDVVRQILDNPNRSTLTIIGPHQNGKSSLLEYLRGLTRDKAVVTLDFQQVELPDELDDFLKQFCALIGYQLNIPNINHIIERVWNQSPYLSCTNFVAEVLSQLNQPLVLLLEEVDILCHQNYGNSFFSMLRSWHNAVRSKRKRNLSQLSMVLSTMLPPYFFLKNTQGSPFNVSVEIHLRDFNKAEVRELYRRYGGKDESALSPIIDMLAGHPFLTQQALYYTLIQNISFEQLTIQALNQQGPFASHLQWVHRLARIDQERIRIVRAILQQQPIPRSSGDTLKILQAIGIINSVYHGYQIRNQLYQQYLEKWLT